MILNKLIAKNDGQLKPLVQEVGLLSCNISGTTYLDIEYIDPELKNYQILVLLCAPKNEYGVSAILIFTANGRKTGDVPHAKNGVLSYHMNSKKIFFGSLLEKIGLITG